jgi:hypothetical protein
VLCCRDAGGGDGRGFGERPAAAAGVRAVQRRAGTTLVGFKVARCASPGRFCLKLPFDCAFVMEQAAADGSGVVVRPQFGPIAFSVAVRPNRPSES